MEAGYYIRNIGWTHERCIAARVEKRDILLLVKKLGSRDCVVCGTSNAVKKAQRFGVAVEPQQHGVEL
jgi:hypothetical protein